MNIQEETTKITAKISNVMGKLVNFFPFFIFFFHFFVLNLSEIITSMRIGTGTNVAMKNIGHWQLSRVFQLERT